MGKNYALLIADLFLYCYERDLMSNLQTSKRFDLIDKFNDTSRYLDDIFTIETPAFAEHIPDIYPRELQLNKANMSDKETSFLDLNIKVALSIEDRERNLTKSVLARVCTLNVCGYSTLLRSVQ